MAERVTKQKPVAPRKEKPAAEVKAKAEARPDLKTEIDELLDEIDGVLESNAAEFVKQYVQKGGE